MISFLFCALAGCGKTGAPSVGETGPGETGPGETGADGETNDDEPGPLPEAAPACGKAAKPDGDQIVELTSGGMDRSVLVHVPPGYDPAVPAPLVLAYHFSGSTPASMSQLTALGPAADAAGVVLAYPVGHNGSFNAGKCCGKAWEDGIDDVAFTRDMIAAIADTHCVDMKRIYATGMSNGAMMAYRLACELSDTIAGIAPVAGALHVAEPCAPSRSIPVLAIHGTADTVIPYQGGQGQPPFPLSGDLMFGSVSDSISAFREANGCTDVVEEAYQKGNASCRLFTGCKGGGSVELCTIQDGGHTWPSGTFPPVLGETSMDLDASQAIMTFFHDHVAH